MFGSRRDRPKKNFYWDLVGGDPITPNHERPKSIGSKSGNPTELENQFFTQFADFADTLNRWLSDDYVASRWRLQELSNTELKLGFRDEPSFGRRFEIFCGPVKLGTMEIEPSYLDFPQTKRVRAVVQLQWVRLLSWDNLVDFLSAVVSHIKDDNDVENEKNLHAAMTRSLWNSLQIHDQELGLDWGELEVTFLGGADFYLRRKAGRNAR